MKASVLKKRSGFGGRIRRTERIARSLKIRGLEKEHLLTAKAYQMRLVLQGIYECQTRAEADGKFEKWCAWVEKECDQKGNELLQPMLRAAEMIRSHRKGILVHWKEGLTTAFLEGVEAFSVTKSEKPGAIKRPAI